MFFFLLLTGTLHIGLLTVPTLQTTWSLVKPCKECFGHDFVLHSLCIVSMFADKINDTKFGFFPLIIVFSSTFKSPVKQKKKGRTEEMKLAS